MSETIRERIVISPWLTSFVAAKYLGIAVGTLRNWTRTGFVPHSKRGRVVRYHREELDRWLAEAKQATTRETAPGPYRSNLDNISLYSN